MNEDPDAPNALGARDVHHTYHDPDERGSISTAVIEAVAAVAGVDPSRTRVPLDRSINPDALDNLFEHRGDRSDDPVFLVIPIWEYRVVVHADGNIFVHEEGYRERPDRE